MVPVCRIESPEESPATFPTLAAAMQLRPRSTEACIRTSPGGVCLAQSSPGPELLEWVLTWAGQDVADHAGWTAGAPTLSPQELDTALSHALADDLARAS
jgi:hypothetical protein